MSKHKENNNSVQAVLERCDLILMSTPNVNESIVHVFTSFRMNWSVTVDRARDHYGVKITCTRVESYPPTDTHAHYAARLGGGAPCSNPNI